MIVFSSEGGGKMNTRKAVRGATKSRSKNSAWQIERSLLTRQQILEATVRCLVSVGYAETLTETIAREAKVSRGALMHHFKSRAEVFRAVAEFIAERRAAEFEQLVMNNPTEAGRLPDLNTFYYFIRQLRGYYSSPFFIAEHELLRGARGDASLTSAIELLQQSLRRSTSETLRALPPRWEGLEAVRDRLYDLISAAFQGAAINPVRELDEARIARTSKFLAEIAYREFTEAYAALHKGKPITAAPKARRVVKT